MWLPKKEYFAKLKDPRWQKKRLKILERDNFTCAICGDTKNTLHVHHRFYLEGLELWGYKDCVYITLCENCHEYETQRIPQEIFNLNTVIKSSYFSDDIKKIWESFLDFNNRCESNDKANIIKFALTEMQDEITKKYLKSIKKRGKKNGCI